MSGAGGFLLGFVIGILISAVLYYKMMKLTYKYVKMQDSTMSATNHAMKYVDNIAKKVKKWQKK